MTAYGLDEETGFPELPEGETWRVEPISLAGPARLSWLLAPKPGAWTAWRRATKSFPEDPRREYQRRSSSGTFRKSRNEVRSRLREVREELLSEPLPYDFDRNTLAEVAGEMMDTARRFEEQAALIGTYPPKRLGEPR